MPAGHAQRASAKISTVTKQLVRCNTGIDLTVGEFLHFDGVLGARHAVPARLHCELQHGHRDPHIAFVQTPGEDDGVWWLRWDATSRVPIEWRYCLAKDPGWPAEADEDDDMYCGLPIDHRGVHQWQMQCSSSQFCSSVWASSFFVVIGSSTDQHRT